MRRKDRETPEKFALAMVDKCIYASLATVGEDGYPYALPLSIVRDGRSIYFHCAPGGRKINNLKNQPEVCLVCVGDTFAPEDEFTVKYESAIVFGRAEEVVSDEEKIQALRLLSLRHTPGNMADFDKAIKNSLGRTAVWKIEIASLTGKRNFRGPDGA